MPVPRAYELVGRSVLAKIVSRGLGTEFGALWGELQFAPRDEALGAMALKGHASGPVFPHGHMIRLGTYWLYYFVNDEQNTVWLLDLLR